MRRRAGAHLSGRGRRGAVDPIKGDLRPEGLGPPAGQAGLGCQSAGWRGPQALGDLAAAVDRQQHVPATGERHRMS